MTTGVEKPYNGINALVTGGASGLGYAVAESIVQQGGRVCIVDSNRLVGEQAVEKLGSNALYLPTDVTSESAVDAAVAQAEKTFGALRLVVNCAGIAPSRRVLARDGLMKLDEFSTVIGINLIGSFNVCRAVVNVMQHNKPNDSGERGVLINTASIAAYEGQIGQVAYSASKGGIVSMSLPLAREFARVGIRVMAIAPGLFKTPLFDELPPPAVEALANSIPFPKRLGQVDEFAALVCQIYQNPMLNGETIRLDGALRM